MQIIEIEKYDMSKCAHPTLQIFLEIAEVGVLLLILWKVW